MTNAEIHIRQVVIYVQNTVKIFRIYVVLLKEKCSAKTASFKHSLLCFPSSFKTKFIEPEEAAEDWHLKLPMNRDTELGHIQTVPNDSGNRINGGIYIFVYEPVYGALVARNEDSDPPLKGWCYESDYKKYNYAGNPVNPDTLIHEYVRHS